MSALFIIGAIALAVIAATSFCNIRIGSVRIKYKYGKLSINL